MENVYAKDSGLLSLSDGLEAFGLFTTAQQCIMRRSTNVLQDHVFRIVYKSWKHIVSKISLLILSRDVFNFGKGLNISFSEKTHHTITKEEQS